MSLLLCTYTYNTHAHIHTYECTHTHIRTGRADKEDEILKKHVLVQAIEIASKPLEGLLLKTNNEDEIKIIKEQMRDLR